MIFGTIDEFKDVDSHNNPVSFIILDDGIVYRMAHFPSHDADDDPANTSRRAVYTSGGRYASVQVSSELTNGQRVTRVRVGPFKIEWIDGKLNLYSTPDTFPKAAKNNILHMKEDVNVFIVTAIHYIAMLGLWKDKKHDKPNSNWKSDTPQST